MVKMLEIGPCPHCGSIHQYTLRVVRNGIAKTGPTTVIKRTRYFECPATSEMFEHRVEIDVPHGMEVLEVIVLPVARAEDRVVESGAVFVSYSRSDAAIVAPLVGVMRLGGAKVFLDFDSLEPGERWRWVLAESIERASILLSVVPSLAEAG